MLLYVEDSYSVTSVAQVMKVEYSVNHSRAVGVSSRGRLRQELTSTAAFRYVASGNGTENMGYYQPGSILCVLPSWLFICRILTLLSL